MGQKFAHLPVPFRVALADNGMLLIGKAASVVEVTLDEGLVACWPEPVNVFP